MQISDVQREIIFTQYHARVQRLRDAGKLWCEHVSLLPSQAQRRQQIAEKARLQRLLALTAS